MTGIYADVPGHRMAYDRDGSLGFIANLSASTVSVMSAANLNTLNDEDSDSVAIYDVGNATADYAYGLIFPELRDVVGWRSFHTGFGGGGGGSLQYSTNTSNGLDGSWLSAGGASGYGETNPVTAFSKTLMRTGIAALAVTGAKAIRVRRNAGSAFGANSWNTLAFHLYGSPASGEAPNRLRLWHPTLDQEVGPAHFDWGDVQRNSNGTIDFRVKNPSATLTANDVTLTTEALTNTSPSIPPQFTYSPDATTYTSSLNIGDLAPGAISSVLTVKRTTPSNAALSLWWARVIASAASFS